MILDMQNDLTLTAALDIIDFPTPPVVPPVDDIIEGILLTGSVDSDNLTGRTQGGDY